MSSDMSLYLKGSQYSKVYFFYSTIFILHIVKGHPNTVEHELCIIIFNIQIKAIFLWCNYKT